MVNSDDNTKILTRLTLSIFSASRASMPPCWIRAQNVVLYRLLIWPNTTLALSPESSKIWSSYNLLVSNSYSPVDSGHLGNTLHGHRSLEVVVIVVCLENRSTNSERSMPKRLRRRLRRFCFQSVS